MLLALKCFGFTLHSEQTRSVHKSPTSCFCLFLKRRALLSKVKGFALKTARWRRGWSPRTCSTSSRRASLMRISLPLTPWSYLNFGFEFYFWQSNMNCWFTLIIFDFEFYFWPLHSDHIVKTTSATTIQTSFAPQHLSKDDLRVAHKKALHCFWVKMINQVNVLVHLADSFQYGLPSFQWF